MAVSQNSAPRVSESNRWFHPRISGKEAVKLLVTKGCVGSFLVRESGSRPGNYTLSVRRESHVVHVQIDNDGDFYDITGCEFASLAELISYYSEQGHPIKEANGNLIVPKYPLYNTETSPSSEPWFHGRLDSKLAETLLKQKGSLNSFLVRERSTVPGEFVLCILTSPDVVKNLIVHCQNGEYFPKAKFVKYRFASLSDLVEHKKKMPMVAASGEVIMLGEPLAVSAVSPKQLANQTSNVSAAVAQNSSSEKHLEEFEQLQKQDYPNKSSRTEGKNIKNQREESKKEHPAVSEA